MSGQPGYEFIGNWEDAGYVKDALLKAGEDFGLVHVGSLAYSTNGIESGWIPTPTPGIYTDPKLEDYRKWLSLFSYEGQRAIHGTDFSEDISHYYVSPFELGYGRSIFFNHDFVGRDALERAMNNVPRTKVTLELDADDVRDLLGDNPDFFLSYARYRIEADSVHVGTTFYTGYLAPLGRILALSLIANEHSEPGTQVGLVYGEHPGPGTAPDADLGFKRLRATVQTSPYNEFARTQYRKD
jgi:glycine cleavage system aminomethyltransferase T